MLSDRRRMVIGPLQLLVIAALVLLFFGASRLGDVGRGLGQGVRAFKKGMQGEAEDEAREPERRELVIEPVEDDAAEGVPMRKRITAKKPSAKKLAAKHESEDDDEEQEERS